MKDFFFLKIAGIIIILLFLLNPIHSQVYFRIEANFSLKEKFSDGTQKLTMGKVYFDKYIQKLVYDISFPEKEIIVFIDSNHFIINKKTVDTLKSDPNFIRLSLFNLSLNGSLPYFGLKESVFELTHIESEENMVISTWETPKSKKIPYMKVLLSQIDKKLNGIITYNDAGVLISKQLFEDYINNNGFEFPTKVIQFFYFNNVEQIKLINYSNIAVNSIKNEAYYNYSIFGN